MRPLASDRPCALSRVLACVARSPRRPARILALGLGLALGVAVLSPADAGWWDDLDKGEAVRLADVFAQPSAHTDHPLSFFCILLGRDEVFYPIGTPFTEAKWDNVAVWDDGAPIWEEETFKRRARPYLYIEKSHPQRDALFRLDPYTRLEVTARVRAVHRGIPFLEILSWRLSGWRLGERVVRAVILGDNKVREGGDRQLEAALDSYTSALVPDLPPVYALQVQKRAADVLRRLGRHDEAEAMEGTEIHGARFAPDSPTAVGPSGMQPPISEDVPGTPLAAPPAAPLLTPSTDLPGVPVEAGAAAPTVPSPAPGIGTPLIERDLPGVEVPPPAATAPPPSPAPGVPAPPLPAPGARTFPLEPDLPGVEVTPPAVSRPPPPAPTPSVAPPASPSFPAPSPPARAGELPAPRIRPTTSRDLPPPPAEGSTGSDPAAPAAVVPAAPPAAGAPPAAAFPPPGAPPPTATPSVPTSPPSLPPPVQGTPPKRQPRLEGVK